MESTDGLALVHCENCGVVLTAAFDAVIVIHREETLRYCKPLCAAAGMAERVVDEIQTAKESAKQT